MEQKLAKRSDASIATDKSSSKQCRTLIKMLDLASQVMGKELAPEETKLWLETFKGEPDSMVEWAFKEYLRTAEYFPKPAQIGALISKRRAALIAKVRDYVRIDRKAVEAEQSTPEWQQASAAARAMLTKIAEQKRL